MSSSPPKLLKPPLLNFIFNKKSYPSSESSTSSKPPSSGYHPWSAIYVPWANITNCILLLYIITSFIKIFAKGLTIIGRSITLVQQKTHPLLTKFFSQDISDFWTKNKHFLTKLPQIRENNPLITRKLVQCITN